MAHTHTHIDELRREASSADLAWGKATQAYNRHCEIYGMNIDLCRDQFDTRLRLIRERDAAELEALATYRRWKRAVEG